MRKDEDTPFSASPAARQPTVLVVDDDESVLVLIAGILRNEGMLVETFPSAEAFLAASRLPPTNACVLLDLQLPELDGVGVQRELTARGIDVPVVFVTATADIPTTVEVMKSGAVDLIEKPFRAAALVAAVRKALERGAAARQQRTQLNELRARLKQLTAREQEVLQHVVAGHANKQMAALLDISEKTVEVHRGRVMSKMGADSLAELVRQSVVLGIAPASGERNARSSDSDSPDQAIPK